MFTRRAICGAAVAIGTIATTVALSAANVISIAAAHVAPFVYMHG